MSTLSDVRVATAEAPPVTAGVWQAIARRTLDLTVAVVVLVVLAPALLVIALAIRLESPGPALFQQVRLGLDGRRFTLLKFRTMRVGGDDASLRALIASELAGEDTSVEGSCKLADARVTRFGGFLRRTSLDELPQLLNVLTGRMCLVGPRPCLDWEAEMFGPEYAARFDVPPGLTGLWQVSGRSTLGTLEMLELDVSYVHTRSLRGDLAILALTIPALFGSGAR